eukprot:jgi/Orpsp1_1/1191903/evm.model.d7180000089293.1
MEFFDRVSSDKREQVNTKMAKLVDMAIDKHVIPDQVSIEAIANECFNVYKRNYQAAYSAFSYHIPEKI